MDSEVIVNLPGLRNPSPHAVYFPESLPTWSGRDILCGIYTIRNLQSGSCYVGSSVDIYRRLRAHLSQLRRGAHHSIRLQAAWHRLGESAFAFAVEKLFETHDEALAFEATILSASKPAYNSALTPESGFKGRRHTDVGKAKISASRKGKGLGPRVFSEAHRKALSDAAPRSYPGRLGIKYSSEARANMAASARAKFANGYVNG